MSDQPVAAPTHSGRSIVLIVLAVVAVVVGAMGALLWFRKSPGAPGMIYFSASSFPAGAARKTAAVPAFFLDETEVSNSAFAEFCRATGCTPPDSAPDLPAVGITVAQARAFAQWSGKRLPTALEWERAARGIDGYRYPWGDAADPSRANVSDNPSLTVHALMPVKSFTAIPVYQMIGNASEIVEGATGPEIRGGSLNMPLSEALTYAGKPVADNFSAADVGFRCAKTP
jgi:formylglycine-generating enzyme required for sulfatase activity